MNALLHDENCHRDTGFIIMVVGTLLQNVILQAGCLLNKDLFSNIIKSVLCSFKVKKITFNFNGYTMMSRCQN